MIKFDKVKKTYNKDCVVLESVDLEIKGGEFVSIIGPCGAGKSTLLKMLYAEEKPTEGEIYFNGNPMSELKKRDVPKHRRSIGTVFQDFKLLPHKDAFENVSFALEVLGISNNEISEDVPKIFDIVGLSDKIHSFPKELSIGEQQKVAIARALVHKPMVIIADEPTGNLDPVASEEILGLLLKINEMGTTVILATHDKVIVDKAGKRVITMESGKIVSDEARGKYKIK